MKYDGPKITKRNTEWFERVCPEHITKRAAKATEPGFFNPGDGLYYPWSDLEAEAKSFYSKEEL